MILIFGGTTEGRLAVDVCEQAGKRYYYSTKGDRQDVEMHNGVRLTGPMVASDFLYPDHSNPDADAVRCIIDAAHPFAENLHNEIMKVGLPVIRLMRQPSERIAGVTYCDGYDDAITRMQSAGINRLLALSGANTIKKLKPYWAEHQTIFRILNREESLNIANANGLPAENIIFYNDDLHLPTIEEETEMMRSIGCDAIVTKESGISGGFEQKVRAALNLGMKVFVVKAPPVVGHPLIATGRHTLRRAIEQTVPDFFPLKTGLTTGACATAATKAALLSLLTDELPEEVAFALPDGEVLTMQVECNERGTATVVKPDNDDPDVTKGCRITAKVVRRDINPDEPKTVRFLQGEGVGRVTLPGLGIPVGEPAVNPTPRRMIENEIRSLSDEAYDVTISVENGRELALRTFNHKVGVVDGISIIGTSGIVHPLSNEAFIQSIRRELEVARAVGCEQIGFVSGMKGEKHLLASGFCVHPEGTGRIVHYGNFVGEALKAAYELGFRKVTLAIMIGKAVKLAEGHLDTHSHKVTMNKDFLCRLAPDYEEQISGITMARELWNFMPDTFFEAIKAECLKHCREAFPTGSLNICLPKD